MNIQQAKEQIKNTITAYRSRDEYGRLVIPQQRQRPVILMGPPGIGKTAVMEQIAQEMELPLVSYSMTHHTRQSALGLPFILEKEYDGKSYRVTEYTMSEIIAAVCDKMEQTGLREGILFLDEINCVSETLAPSMLQFLQYKVFGQHKVPEGWIIVTAGNPPEYNQNVREFDIVTWDRLKRIDVKADYDTWRTWAVEENVHPAVISYLDIRKTDFITIETTVDGKRFATPRGWVDLSDMLRLYEQHGLEVDYHLTSQYLQNEKINKAFSSYYDLWLKYRSDYRIDTILNGKSTKQIEKRAKEAAFDERISLVSLLMDALMNEIRPAMRERAVLEETTKTLQAVRRDSAIKRKPFRIALDDTLKAEEGKLLKSLSGGILTRQKEEITRQMMAFLRECESELPEEQTDADAFAKVKALYDAMVKKLQKQAEAAGKKLENLFNFAEKVFGEGQEILIIVTELTSSADAAGFISQYGSPGYFRHNKELLFYERQIKVISEIDAIEGSDFRRETSSIKN